MDRREVRLVKEPKFKMPKIKFSGRYFKKRIREMKHSLPKKGL